MRFSELPNPQFMALSSIHCLKLALMGIYSYSIPLALPQGKHREGLHYASTSAIVVWVQTYHPHSGIALQNLVFRCYT